MNQITEAVVTIAIAVIGLAIVAVLVSRNANTAGVLQAGASGLGNDIGTAISPVTGAAPPVNLTYPTQTYGFGG